MGSDSTSDKPNYAATKIERKNIILRSEKYSLRHVDLCTLRDKSKSACRMATKVKKLKAAPLSKYRRKTANERERSRMREINIAFENLRLCVPQSIVTSEDNSSNEKLTKITTLRLAMKYIKLLTEKLDSDRDLVCGITIRDEELLAPKKFGWSAKRSERKDTVKSRKSRKNRCAFSSVRKLKPLLSQSLASINDIDEKLVVSKSGLIPTTSTSLVDAQNHGLFNMEYCLDTEDGNLHSPISFDSDGESISSFKCWQRGNTLLPYNELLSFRTSSSSPDDSFKLCTSALASTDSKDSSESSMSQQPSYLSIYDDEFNPLFDVLDHSSGLDLFLT